MNCLSCKHCFQTELDTQLKRQTMCRRYPPTVQGLPTSQGIVNVTMYPPVNDQMVCGEYGAKVKLS